MAIVCRVCGRPGAECTGETFSVPIPVDARMRGPGLPEPPPMPPSLRSSVMPDFVKVQVKPGDIRKVNQRDLATFLRDNPGATVQDAPVATERPQSVRAANGEGDETPEPETGAAKAQSASEDKARKAAQNKSA